MKYGLGGQSLQKRIMIIKILLDAIIGELHFADLFETEKAIPRGFKWAYWLTFLLITLLPTWPTESQVYFPVILALIGAWLFGISQLQKMLTTSHNFLEIAEDRLWNVLFGIVEKLHTAYPEEFPEASNSNLLDLRPVLPQITREVLPSLAAKILFWLSLRAFITAVLAFLGLFIGPFIARIHWGYWSPVSLLFGLSFPYVFLLLLSGVIFFSTPAYLRGIVVAKSAMNGTFTTTPNPPRDPGATASGLQNPGKSPGPHPKKSGDGGDNADVSVHEQ